MKLRALSVLVAVGLSTAAVMAQEPVPTLAAADAGRGQVAAALSKGDLAGAEKLMATAGIAGPAAAAGGNINFEQIRSCGFYPQETRLECTIEIKQPAGYGGPIGSSGTFQFVAFYIDWHGNGWQRSDYVGSGIVHITDGSAKTNFAVYRDFNPPGGPRTQNNNNMAPTNTNGPILRARAILSWGTPIGGPNQVPVWGNVVDFQIRFMPIR